jgi:adenylate cyclase
VGKEIERKFLVNLKLWKPVNGGTHFKQGYLNSQKERVVRVRIEGDRAKLTPRSFSTAFASSR